MLKKTALLTFDIEEFDMPLEYGSSISLDKQLHVSANGARLLLDILREHNIAATFFSTVIFAENKPDLIHRIVSGGHELASHSYYHSQFENADLSRSKVALENLAQHAVKGFRMPRMMPVSNEELRKAGYTYNSSINPIFLPGRYNNLKAQRTINEEGNLIQVPASTTPLFRFPLFWLSFHLVPQSLFQLGCRSAIDRDQYLHLYFHPWEFIDLSPTEYCLPAYLSYNTGEKMVRKFQQLLHWMKRKQYAFSTLSNFLADPLARSQYKI